MPKKTSSSKKGEKIAVTLFPKPPSPILKSKPRKKSTISSDRSTKAANATRSKSVTPTTAAVASKNGATKNDSIANMMATVSKQTRMQKVSDSLAPPGVFHSLGNVSKVSTPASPSDAESVLAPELEEHETSQMWILRHLRLHLEDVNDSVLVNFVLQQDVTPFRNFMMDFHNEKKCLFVIVTRYEPRSVVSPTIAIDEPKPVSPVKVEEKPPKTETTKTANKTGKKMLKPKTKSKTTKAKATNKSVETKDTEQENDSTTRQQIIDEIVEHERLTVPCQEGTVQLQWSDTRAIPDDTTEFVFVISRMKERRSERSEMDQQYFTGYIRNSTAFKKINEISHQVLGPKMNFEREMDLMLYANAAMSNNVLGREKWQNPAENFENFISDALSHAFWQPTTSTGRNDSIISLGDQRSAIESVESLLRPQIQAFVKDPTKANRTRLWLELSLYELKFLDGSMPLDQVTDQLKRTLAIFQTLTLLSAGKEVPLAATEWLQKALFYTIELVARLIATNVKDHVAELTVDLFVEQTTSQPEPVDTRVRVVAKPVFSELIKIGISKLYSKTSEEYGVLENIKQCLRIFDYVEDEIEKISKHVSYMRSPIHDMLMDRRPLDEGFLILKNIFVLFEETYFESALESGNIETIKSVCLKLAADQKRLREITATLETDKNNRLPHSLIDT